MHVIVGLSVGVVEGKKRFPLPHCPRVTFTHTGIKKILPKEIKRPFPFRHLKPEVSSPVKKSRQSPLGAKEGGRRRRQKSVILNGSPSSAASHGVETWQYSSLLRLGPLWYLSTNRSPLPLHPGVTEPLECGKKFCCCPRFPPLLKQSFGLASSFLFSFFRHPGSMTPESQGQEKLSDLHFPLNILINICN